jgi:protein SCO1
MRLGLALAALVAVSFGAFVAVGLVTRPAAGPLAVSSSREGPYRGSEPPGGIRLPDFALRDYTGEPVGSRDLEADVLLVTFLDSRCTEACPIIASQIAQTLDTLAPEELARVEAIAISTDPRGDTTESVRSFLAKQGALGKLRWLTGSEPELRRLWRSFRILSSLETGEPTLHSAPLRIYDQRREWVATLHAGIDLTAESLAHDIRRALEEAA